MHRPLHLLILILACALGPFAVQGQMSGQPSPAVKGLTGDICNCIGNIPSESTERELQSSLRDCLEQAVIRYPREVRELLKEKDSDADTGYYLGRVIGRTLEKDCDRFKAIKKRISPDGEASVNGGLS